MTTDELMRLLADRPGCCARLREAAEIEIRRLRGGFITREAYEGSVASRCRNWRGLHLAHFGELLEAAADEIDRLQALVEGKK